MTLLVLLFSFLVFVSPTQAKAGTPIYVSFGYNNFMGGLRLSYHF